MGSFQRKIVLLFVVLSLFGTTRLTGCTEPSKEKGPGDSSAPDARPGERVKESPAPKAALDEPLKANETRAGQITKDSERILGKEAWSKIGDWRIYNDKVAFVLHGVGSSRFFSGGTGQIIDASVVDAKGQATGDLLEEVFPGFGVLRVIRAKKIQLISAGGVDKDAILRVEGEDVGIPVVDAVLKSRAFGGKIQVDYILKPGARHIEIVTTLSGGDRLADMQMGDGLLLGDRTRLFSPIVGFDAEKSVGKPLPWFGSVGEGASYLLAPADAQGKLSIPLTQASIYPAFGAIAAADEDKSVYRRWLFVGDGRFEPLLAALRKIRKAEAGLSTYKGSVKGLKDATTAEIQLRDAKGVILSQTRPDDKGHFSFQLAKGEYTLVASVAGRASVEQKASADASVELSFAAGGELRLTIKEKGPDGKVGGFVPVRVELRGAGSHLFDMIAAEQTFAVPPGKYTVTVSRGFAYEYWQKELTFAPKNGETAVVSEEVVLHRVVDTSGYVGADMHLHASPSADSELPLEQRISSLATEGLHLGVSTDHDVFVDYAPLIKKLGLGKWLASAIGQEISPIPFHLNMYPLSQLPTNEPRYFSVGWAEYADRVYQRSLSAPEIWAIVRKKYKAQIIQINHPRSSQAFLGAIGYDRKKGIKALKAGVFDSNWDAIEVLNGKRRENFLAENLFDYFSFLNQGLFKTAVGNSDSHSAGARPGMPRTMILASTPAGDAMDKELVFKNLKANKAMVYAGPFIKLSGTGVQGPGSQIKASSLELTVEVLAPSWVPVAYIKIYANGKLLQQIDVAASKEVSRHKQTIQLKPTKDTWYVVLAGDDKNSMTHVYPGKLPISMTNAIYLDVDGDGFKAPGLQPE